MQSRPKSAVAILSGGLDSTVALAMSLHEGIDIPVVLTFDYGQRAAARELSAARAIAEHFGLSHQAISLPWMQQLQGTGGLLDRGTALPEPQNVELDDLDYCRKSAKAVWVPNRNGVLLEIGAAVAEAHGASAIVVRFNAEEAATFPDNSVDYINALNCAFAFSTANHVKVWSPTAPLDKSAIVERALSLDFPLNLLWSCYHAGEKMCGRCESCMRLRRGLDAGGVNTHAFFANTLA